MNVNYGFSPGKMFVLVGNSGSGKSTLLHIIAGLVPLTSGTIEARGKKLKRDEVTLILQQPFFYGALSIIENIKLVGLYNRKLTRDEVIELSEQLNIKEILKRRADVCSGGEKARANIVRGISENKRIILVDEPTAHLDYENSCHVAALLNKIAREKIVIISTHQRHIFTPFKPTFLTIADGEVYENF